MRSLLFFFWDTVESEHEKRGRCPNLSSFFDINLHYFYLFARRAWLWGKKDAHSRSSLIRTPVPKHWDTFYCAFSVRFNGVSLWFDIAYPLTSLTNSNHRFHLKATPWKLISNGKILVTFYTRVLRCKSSQAEACYILQDILRNDQSLELLFCGHETQKKNK